MQTRIIQVPIHDRRYHNIIIIFCLSPHLTTSTTTKIIGEIVANRGGDELQSHNIGTQEY